MLGDPVKDPVSGKSALTRLNPQFSNINNRGSNGDSYYQAMNVQFQTTNLHRTGISMVANYTFGHSTDDLSTTFSESNNAFSLGYTNPFNPSLDHGNSDFDIRQRLVLAPMYKTPYFGGSKRSLKNEGLGGWQVTGIYTVRTGTPFTFFDSTENASGYNVARYTPASGVVGKRTFKSIPKGQNGGGNNTYTLGTLPDALDWVNPALQVSDWGPYPAAMTARNTFTGPGAWAFDAALTKDFAITERVNLQFRAEAFDLLNHHNLYILAVNNDAANGTDILAAKGGVAAGTPAGANDERRFGQFALKLNF